MGKQNNIKSSNKNKIKNTESKDVKEKEVYVSFRPGWIGHKNVEMFDENFIKIMNFYLLLTFCDNVSSSGIEMSKYGWDRNVWKKQQLKKYLFKEAKIVNENNYINVLSERNKSLGMSKSLTRVKIKDKFQNIKMGNFIVIKSKKNEIMELFYYIRCALAHGRFVVKGKQDKKRMYIMEAVKYCNDNKEFLLNARMIFEEGTLLKWIEIIQNGEKGLKKYLNDEENIIKIDMFNKIKENKKSNKKDIVNEFVKKNYILNRTDISKIYDECKRKN